MCARFTVLSDTPIASAIAGCAMPFSRNSTIRMPRRCFSGIFQCNAVFSCRIWRLVHLTICSPESDSQGITLTPQRFGTSLPQTADSISSGSGMKLHYYDKHRLPREVEQELGLTFHPNVE